MLRTKRLRFLSFGNAVVVLGTVFAVYQSLEHIETWFTVWAAAITETFNKKKPILYVIFLHQLIGSINNSVVFASIILLGIEIFKC